jgi:hypothetical protein
MNNQVQAQENINPQVQSDIEKLNDINKKQEKRIHALEVKALQLTNLYFVFQGVILSTSSSARSITCHHWWIPFVLSLLAAILNLVAFFFTMRNILSYREQLDQNLEDLCSMRTYRVTRAEVNLVKPGELLHQQDGDQEGPRRQRPDPFKKWKRRVLSYASIGLYLGFSGVVLYGCHAILCHQRSNHEC